MSTAYRVKIFSGHNGSTANIPCGHHHATMLSALRCMRKHRTANQGASLQIRLASTEPWYWIPDEAVERYAALYRMNAWVRP